MSASFSMSELIRRRYSCRTYQPQPIAPDLQKTFVDFLTSNCTGPLGTPGRFMLVAATEDDRAALKGLGTYGFIKDAPGFILGAVAAEPKALEDFGYLLEQVILRATALGLGTCWLGGTFSKSSFAERISLRRDELMPAVASVGHAVDGSRDKDRIRRSAGSNFRLPADVLFFEGGFSRPISRAVAGPLADVLEAVRWAPSASNKQPWRLVHTETGWHFYLERTRGYGKGSLLFRMLRLADLQRTDIGIAMCHFELVARELGIAGSWVVDEPPVASEGREYTATWRPATEATIQ
jgi:nitroreductase